MVELELEGLSDLDREIQLAALKHLEGAQFRKQSKIRDSVADLSHYSEDF